MASLAIAEEPESGFRPDRPANRTLHGHEVYSACRQSAIRLAMAFQSGALAPKKHDFACGKSPA
ncbi:MAG: hypothetical protein ACKOTB_00260 [Planctomycetia bacterium]